MTSEEMDMWSDVCEKSDDLSLCSNGYYADSFIAPTVAMDYALCLEDAEAGNERAQRYLAAFIAYRMTR